MVLNALVLLSYLIFYLVFLKVKKIVCKCNAMLQHLHSEMIVYDHHNIYATSKYKTSFKR